MMNYMTGFLVSCASLLLFSATSFAAPAVKMPDHTDRCPVCGMFVAPYPEWIATIVHNDGEQLFFDGCKDMFRYLFKHQDDQLTAAMIYVTDYYTTQLVPVADAFFVIGSDVYGPMGHELVPIVGRSQAETFSRDHQGQEILTFDEVTPAKLPAD